MTDINEVYRQYSQESLPISWKKDLKEILSVVKPQDLKTMEEHKLFVETLSKLRQYMSEDLALYGKNFPNTIKSLLAVGEDGMYSNSMRFIFELIQNVDDCDYDDIENCKLDIQFLYDPAPGKIILTYNEKGFTPFNVFSITGIAEESKNISADRVEIGEKGIGFKSVFGVAESVHIESGMFSFKLFKDDFTVPVPAYDGYKPVEGTRLTIVLDAEHNAKSIHKQLLQQYAQKDAVLSKNPILFLNKLTHLKMFYDGWRYIEFDVEKKEKTDNGLKYEDEVIISVDMKSNYDGRTNEQSNNISCRRYSQPILYIEEECKSRYGKDIKFSERKHNLIAIFPRLDKDLGSYEGAMYSFLPTQIKISAPMVLHVPFKLDGSREFVDPQGNNLWFQHTVRELERFLRTIYVHLAHEVKCDIINYLPNRNNNLFKLDNEKVRCLVGFQTDAFCYEKIFYCTDGSFNNCKNIISFDKNSNYENPERIHELLGEPYRLFISGNPKVDMKCFGAKIYTDVDKKLFLRGLEKVELFGEVIDILDKLETKIDYCSVLDSVKGIVLGKEHIRVIAAHTNIAQAFTDILGKRLEQHIIPGYSFEGEGDRPAVTVRNTIKELVESADLEARFVQYLNAIDYNIILVDVGNKQFSLACSNAVVVSMTSPLGSFAKLSDPYDSRKTFSATLLIRQASDKLNAVDEEMTNSEYLKLLRGVRQSLINAFGTKAYNSYISVVNNAGSDRKRFLSEILQNADDCEYEKNTIPKFVVRFSDDRLIVSYNEKGFTKDNVRAITAFGESTKKMLLNGEDKAIGEKGVGFKSVFGVAKSVDIHSNGFDFRLTNEKPTIPEKSEKKTVFTGTTMIYELKNPREVRQLFNENHILKLCLCLRKIRELEVVGIHVSIRDEENRRIITLNGKKYELEKINYDFVIDDQEAIDERSTNQKKIDADQTICCYIPPKEFKSDKISLYSGLPVSNIDCLIPLVIDAPFELTTARDDVIECKWNSYVKNAIYEAICRLLEDKKEEMRLDVFRYVRYRNENGISTFQTFSKKYLNSFNWLEKLKEMELLPCLRSDQFVAPGDKRYIIPEIIADVASEKDTQDFDGIIIDTRHKSQYVSLLEFLGCKRSSLEEELSFIKNNVEEYLGDVNKREDLYKYLKDNSQTFINKHIDQLVRSLEIFPIRTEKGTEYVAFTGNMYTHPSQTSGGDFLILETQIMPYEICQAIVGSNYRINQLTEEVYDARYRKNIEDIIMSDKSDEEIAKYLLREFKTNHKNLEKCKISLMGLLDQIPMEMANGEYREGNKYINENDLILEGSLIKYMYVSDKYRDFAEFLECENVLKIHYSDIDVSDLKEISDTDIEDILGDFENYADILMGFYNDHILTEEQIEKYDLQWLEQSQANIENNEDYYEDFPEKKVANIERLKKHVRDQFRSSPNPYVEKKRIIREPLSPVEKTAYTTSMYQSRNNENKCFCQMCKKIISKAYIERNDVQKQPNYGWSQMYLSLCLECSKDYTLLRNNQNVWEHFIEDIKNADLDGIGVYEVPIAHRKITFTATHLAEIQEIIELKAY
ncbi:sacsin N-terminal ATP-binding-like domain-containing protein [Butyrivibrio fibrisolvens]|uniref:sacsin N-terminal ATP-binding-like domain-containing protein n=1 Tax=Butyrivibrio fibrisolvens TaxID=831 RepID=UPI0003B553D5|nr:hypothetical protein [Butyrivibrio fibrisolvens]